MAKPLDPVFHPRWGNVYSIREQNQAKKVWKHLYDAAQRWDALAKVEIQNLVSAAQQKGCPEPPPTPRRGKERESLPEPVPKPCYTLLKEHHHTYYGPAYLRELARPETKWSRQRREPDSLLCCTPCGVLLAVDTGGLAAVRTAYRPDLQPDSGTDDSDYLEQALQRWSQSTMAVDSTWKREVLRQLARFDQQPPQRLSEVWRLALAIGHARALVAKEPEFTAPLAGAEALLEQHQADAEQLKHWTHHSDSILEGLASSLASRDPDEVQDRLLSAQESLVVLEVLGGKPEMERILDRAKQLISSWPRALTGFDRLARARIGVSGPAAQALWQAVLAALSTALGPMAAAQKWIEEARARIEERLSNTPLVAELLSPLILTARLEPSGILLSGAEPEFDVLLVGHCPSGWQLRVFVVDMKHPSGEPLVQDTHFSRTGEKWAFREGWRLHGMEDDTLVIAIAAPALPSTQSLENLLDEASRLPDSRIQEKWLIPSNGRTP